MHASSTAMVLNPWALDRYRFVACWKLGRAAGVSSGQSETTHLELPLSDHPSLRRTTILLDGKVCGKSSDLYTGFNVGTHLHKFTHPIHPAPQTLDPAHPVGIMPAAVHHTIHATFQTLDTAYLLYSNMALFTKFL